MATNNIRNKLFDNAVDLADEDGYIDEVDLTVQPWNRTTVADGQWLNDHAIKPLSSRDLFLADCIDAANLQIETISANLASIGVGGAGSGSSGTNGIVAGKLGRSNATFSDNSDNMSEKSVARVPGGLADTIQPAYSLQYFGFGPQARGAEKLTGSITQNKNAIIQANMNTGIASQIALTPSGMYYRGIESLSPNNYEVLEPKDFLQVMMSPVLTADKSGVITYSTDTNTFNIAALPDATTAVTGVTGNHLTLTENKVCFASAFASDKLYFVCESGFKEYTAPQPQLKTDGGLTADDQGKLQLAMPRNGGMFAFNYNSNSNTITPTLFSLPTYDTADDCSLTANTQGNWVVNRGTYLTLDTTDKNLTIDVTALAAGMKSYLDIPSFASSAAIQPTAANSNVYELKYMSGHFKTANNEFQLNLKNNGGIISDNGLCLSLSGLSAFSADEVSSFTYNGYIATKAGTITPFITVKNPANEDPNQGRLGVNVNFLLHGFTVKDNSSLATVIANFDRRIAALEAANNVTDNNQ